MKVRLPLSLLFACAISSVVGAAEEPTVADKTPTKPTSVFSDPLLKKQWQWDPARNGISIADTWKSGITGSGSTGAFQAFVKSSNLTTERVVIGVVDTWVEPNHEDLLVSKYNPAEEWLDADYSEGLSYNFMGGEIPEDDPNTEEDESLQQVFEGECHGTFVAGMAAAIGGNDLGVVGAAPGAMIAGLHIGSDTNLVGAHISSAFKWASGVERINTSLAYKGEAAVQIRNCSFGSAFWAMGNRDSWQLIEDASRNNVIFVFAAGNERRAEDGSPGSTGWATYGSNPYIINVAATQEEGYYSDFSNYGSNVFVTAPGASVVSTDRTGEDGYNTGGLANADETEDSGTIGDGNYASSDGTSFSSPLVAGVIALGKDVCPVMDVRWAKHALAYSSGHNEAPNFDAEYDEETGKWVQASDKIIAEKEEEEAEEEFNAAMPSVGGTGLRSDTKANYVTAQATGEWKQNSAGYWFNNNYGFGLVDADGFVEKVRDIAYTTVETKQVVAASKVEGAVESGGTHRKSEYVVRVATQGTGTGAVSLLDQPIETVSVNIQFSPEALASDLFSDLATSLRVTLISPDEMESVLVHPIEGEGAINGVAEALTNGYVFLSNAFWGIGAGDTGAWKVRVEYECTQDGQNTEDWVTVSNIEFLMGTAVDESSSGGVAAGKTVNAHALSLDHSDSEFAVNGTFTVEDAVYVNGGTFAIAQGGSVSAYAEAKLQKGAIFVQSGGVSSFAGSGVFTRGLYLYGGNSEITGSAQLSGKINVDGANLTITRTEDQTPTFGEINLYGGNVSLGERLSYKSATIVYGGLLNIGKNVTGGNLSVYGGEAAMNTRAVYNKINVGKIEAAKKEGEEPTLYGGKFVVNGRLVVDDGLAVDGLGYVETKEGSTIEGNVAVKGQGSVAMYGNSLQGTTIDGALSVAESGTVVWSGERALTVTDSIDVVGGVLQAVGKTTLASGKTIQNASKTSSAPTTEPVEVTVSKGGTFAVGQTTIENVALEIQSGATLRFASRSRSDFDSLTIGEGATMSVVEPTGTLGAEVESVNIIYSFGDAIPYTATLINVEEETDYTNENVVPFKVAVEDAPQLLVLDSKTNEFVAEDLVFDVGVSDGLKSVTLKSGVGQNINNHSLIYPQQTAMQSAIQRTLLRNEKTAEKFLSVIDGFELVSDLLHSYDKLGAPANVIAIDELHDKQASAITGALSRRARELRSGFIHADVWSNPLFGQSGFSFSANPNLVAAKGFVPFATLEDDYPLMVWVNGGYSFSEADASKVSVSATESGMLNLALGADYSISDNLAIGLFLGYTNGRSKFDDGDRTEIQSRNVGVYLTGSHTDAIGSYYYTAGLSFGMEEYDFSRVMKISGLSSKAEASPEGWQGVAFIEGGYEWKLQKFSTGPSISLRYVANNMDGYTETSSDAWMRQQVDDFDYDSLQSSLGWRLSYRADFETVSLLPEVRVSWNHEFLGTDEDFTARLAMAGAESYTCTTTSTGDNYASAGVGVTMMLGNLTTVSLDYDVQFMRDDADASHSVNLMFRTRF